MPDQVIREPDDLKTFCMRALCSVGVAESDARITADVLVSADLRGVASHGVAHLRRYVDGLRAGTIAACPQERVVAETPATAAMDAGAGLGPPVSYRAMQRAIQKAVAVGAGFVTVRNSNHFGIAGYYAMLALPARLHRPGDDERLAQGRPHVWPSRRAGHEPDRRGRARRPRAALRAGYGDHDGFVRQAGDCRPAGDTAARRVGRRRERSARPRCASSVGRVQEQRRRRAAAPRRRRGSAGWLQGLWARPVGRNLLGALVWRGICHAHLSENAAG